MSILAYIVAALPALVVIAFAATRKSTMYDSPKAAHFEASWEFNQKIEQSDAASWEQGLRARWAVAKLCQAARIDFRQPDARQRAAKICEAFNKFDGDGGRMGLPIVKVV